MLKQKNLKQKAASGMIWTTIQKFSKMGIQFISGIVLARLLTPFDYGCIGMLMVFITISDNFIDGGFGAALIQKKRPTQTDYSTVFYWNIALSLFLYVLLYLSAPTVAKFYNIPLLSNVLRVQGIILFIYALNVIQRNQLRKQLKFRIIAITRIFTSIIALIVTIVMAVLGFGVWALVTQNLIAAAIPMFVFWVYTKWRPSWSFSWKSFKELFSFGFYMLLTNLLNSLGTQLQSLFIGRIYNPSTLGYYSKALGTERLASHTISGVMSAVSYPLYAEVQDDLPRMRNMIKRLVSTIAFITFPMLAILFLIAKPLFFVLYSERWLDSVPYFQFLCIAGLGACLSAVNTQPIAAIGKSNIMFIWTLIKRSVAIFVIIIGLFVFGIKGLLVGVIIDSWFSFSVNIMLVSKYIGYKWSKQLRDLLPISLVVVFGVIVSLLLSFFLQLDFFVDGLVKLVVFISIYGGWSLLFQPEAYVYTKGIIPMIVNKK